MHEQDVTVSRVVSSSGRVFRVTRPPTIEVPEVPIFPTQTNRVQLIGGLIEKYYSRTREIKPQVLICFAASQIAWFSKMYDVHQTEQLSSYGLDLLGPTMSWYGTQAWGVFVPRLKDFAQSKKPLVLYTIFALGTEGLQYLTQDANDTSDFRYDPWDFAALAAGVGLALAINKYITKNPG